MPSEHPRSTDPDSTTGRHDAVDRRRFLAAGAGLGAALFAGCTSSDVPGTIDGGEGTSGDGSADGSATTTSGGDGPDSDAAGTFRLLISDQPVAIDEFDSLNVSFDRARIFRADGEEPEPTETATVSPTQTTVTENGTETESPNGSETETPNGTATDLPTVTVTETETPDDDEDESDDEDEADDEDEGEQGFFVIDLGGATVDLTQVVGDKAIGIFEGELAAGKYTKIELYAAEVGGVVDGESVDVKIPSGKLQIVKPFEVIAGETVSFVFDINVVKKGQSGGYNLLPVIAKSGVAGQDVEVDEVGKPDDPADDDDDEADDEPAGNETEDDDGGPPSEAGPPDNPGGNESDRNNSSG